MDRLNILVIDDEHVICNGCRMVLEEAGHRVDAHGTCRKGLDAVRSNRYDVVLLDMKLPDMDGTDFLKRIPRSPFAPAVIVMTGYATVKNAVVSMKLGAVEYLPKPFTDEELIDTVRRATSQSAPHS